jgi:hypothetical protein
MSPRPTSATPIGPGVASRDCGEGVLVCLAGIGLWPILHVMLEPTSTPRSPPIPVEAAVAQAGDVPVYLTGSAR